MMHWQGAAEEPLAPAQWPATMPMPPQAPPLAAAASRAGPPPKRPRPRGM
eukprot:CAMPEP_0180829730 /NCGR_PEP_ID=MMETSP1038_2-20121128/75424_1 /TAXON_ID=632150 /ORGANISM="Azadinium spinosum, Strain 3D9" /LENGTH=49 /DNA_ID= /DNA_START= /DNA_END= /DNA_ORIENTATION=